MLCFASSTLTEIEFGERKCIRAANKGVLSKVLDFETKLEVTSIAKRNALAQISSSDNGWSVGLRRRSKGSTACGMAVSACASYVADYVQ